MPGLKWRRAQQLVAQTNATNELPPKRRGSWSGAMPPPRGLGYFYAQGKWSSEREICPALGSPPGYLPKDNMVEVGEVGKTLAVSAVVEVESGIGIGFGGNVDITHALVRVERNTNTM